MKDLTIYVHVPFCNSKCHFCTYVAHIDTKDLVKRQDRYQSYVDALLQQIRFYMPRLVDKGYALRSIYFGGGTPTSFSSEQLVSILSTIREYIPLSVNYTDTTLETTPENIANQDFDVLLKGGFDRVSMGVQSMLDDRLKSLGRCHTNGLVENAVNTFHSSGINNVNIDLMVGLPSESEAEVAESLGRALGLGINHFTIYTYMPVIGTVMQKQLKTGYVTEELEDRHSYVRETMSNAGYNEYMYQYYSNDNTRCICDEVYFGLTNEWMGFGADCNSLIGQKVLIAPNHFQKFIDNPLKPRFVAPSARFVPFLDKHFYWMLISETGVMFDRMESLLGVTMEEALSLSEYISVWYNYLTMNDYLHRDEERLIFPTTEARTHFGCKRVELAYDIRAKEAFFDQYKQSA